MGIDMTDKIVFCWNCNQATKHRIETQDYGAAGSHPLYICHVCSTDTSMTDTRKIQRKAIEVASRDRHVGSYR